MDEVLALTPQHRGRWRVTSRGSSHVFDLVVGTYQRTAGPGRQQFPHDERPMTLTRVERWPTVGEVFFIWLDDPDQPDDLEHWRQSSTIRSIVSLPARDRDATGDAVAQPGGVEQR